MLARRRRHFTATRVHRDSVHETAFLCCWPRVRSAWSSFRALLVDGSDLELVLAFSGIFFCLGTSSMKSDLGAVFLFCAIIALGVQ